MGSLEVLKTERVVSQLGLPQRRRPDSDAVFSGNILEETEKTGT